MRLERLFPLLLVALFLPFAMLVPMGVGASVPGLPLVVGVVVVGGTALVWRRSVGRLAEVRWARHEPEPAALADQAGAGPAPGSVVRALGRVEARELATSGWFGGGLGFCLFFVVLGGVAFADDFERSWWGYVSVLVLLAYPLCGFTVVAAHRAVTRGARDGLEELYQSCPVGWDRRTKAHLLSGWVAVAAAIVFAATLTALVAVNNPMMYGPIDDRAIADFALVPVLAFGAVALGTALGRWSRWALTPVLAVAAVAFVEQVLFELGDKGSNVRDLTAWGLWPEVDPVYHEPRPLGRVAWLVGLTVAVAGLALVRTRRRRVPAAVVGLGLAVALAGAVLVTRPLSDDTADRLAAYVVDPARHEVCSRLSRDVNVCVLEPYGDLGQTYAETLAPVVDALPPVVFDRPVTLRTLFDGQRDMLDAEVKDRVPKPLPGPPDGTLRLSFEHTGTHIAQARFRLATHAIGLPTETTTTIVTGEARGVVVLWYATRGLSSDEAEDAVTPEVTEGERVTDSMRGDVWPSICGEGRALQWSQQDLAAARALFSLPEERVNRELADGWERWTNPDTSTDGLLDALGLPLVGPPDKVSVLGTDPAC